MSICGAVAAHVYVKVERIILMTSQLLFTIATLLLSANCDCLFFNDGHLELENPMRNFSNDPTLPHFSYAKAQVRELRDLLNKPEVVAVLEQD